MEKAEMVEDKVRVEIKDHHISQKSRKCPKKNIDCIEKISVINNFVTKFI